MPESEQKQIFWGHNSNVAVIQVQSNFIKNSFKSITNSLIENNYSIYITYYNYLIKFSL